MEDFGTPRLSIGAPSAEDNAATSYMEVAENRFTGALDAEFRALLDDGGEAAAKGPAAPPSGSTGDPEFDKLLSGEADQTQAPAPAASGEAAPAAAAPEAKAPPADEGLAASILSMAGAVGGDVLGGLKEAPRQMVGGVMDALDETAQFMQDAIPLPGVQLYGADGNFDPAFISAETLAQQRKAEQDLFSMMTPDKADTVTGGFARSASQFLTAFIPATGAVKALRVGKFATGLAAGAIADAVAFDPDGERLSTFLNQVPALQGIVPDYLADNNPENNSRWENRMKNAIEGLGIGAATDGLLAAFKYYKAAGKAKAAERAADPVGAQVEAAKDAMKAAARDEIVNDIPDEALRGMGDPTPDAPLFVEATENETSRDAFSRIAAGRVRAEQADVNNAALNKINEVRSRFAAKAGVDGRDPMDEMIDNLRSGSGIMAKIPRRPISEIVKGLGGVDPTSSLAGDLRSRGITSKAFPGLFKRGGAQALDNISAREHEIFNARNLASDDGYIPQQSFIDGLEAELKGDPWKTPENQRAYDELVAPLDDLDEHLNRLGIDYKNMSNESIKARIAQIADEEAMFARDTGQDALFSGPRNEADMQAEAALEYEAKGFAGKPLPQKGLAPANITQDGTVHVGEVGGVHFMIDRPDGVQWEDTGFVNPDGQFLTRKEATAWVDKNEGKIKPSENMNGGLDALDYREQIPSRLQKGATPAKPKGKVYLNLARIQGADDVKAAMQEMVDMDAGHIKDKTRGVVSNDQTIKESAQEYQDLNDLIGRPPGPMNAAQAVAARRLLTSSGEQIVQLAKKAQAPDATPADLYAFRRSMAVHYAIQSEVVAARTETARALQSWAIPAGATKARSQAIAELISQSGGASDLQAMAKAVATVGDNPTALNTMARELGKGKFGKALYQVWINGLLSSPKTHMVNIMSNSMTALWAIPERYVAAGFSKAFYDGEIETGEAAAAAFGFVKGIRDGARLVALGNRAEGAQGLGDVFNAFVDSEAKHPNAISAEAFGLDAAGMFGRGVDFISKYVINPPGAALAAEDKLFKTIGYRMELQAQAYRMAASEGLEGKAFAERVADVLLNPPESIKADAMSSANYQTFTNKLGPAGTMATALLNKVPGARWVVPFVKTPVNIMKYTFARTPLAYAMASVKADVAAGGARAAQAHARVALGTMTMLTIMDMAAEGTITGRGPIGSEDNPNLRRNWLANNQPYSVKVNGRWYAYNRADPIAMIIGLGADMAEIAKDAEAGDMDTVAMAGVIALAQNLSSKTYMSGIYDFIGAIDPNNPSGNIGKYVADFAGGFVPYSSALRNTRSALDPIARDTKNVVFGDDGKPDEIATYLDNMVAKIRNGIPGMSDQLPAMRDLFGDPIDRSSGLGFGYDFLSPIASKVDDPDPISQVIIDNKIPITLPPRQIKGVKLSAAEYSEFQQLAGAPLKEYLGELIKSQGFKSLSDGPDGMKAEVIRDIIGNFRESAAAQMMAKNPQLRERSFLAQQDKAKQLTGQ